LPVKADAEKGGFVANTAGLSPTNFGDVLDGSLHGYWGFESYNGPEFRLENTRPQHWQLVDEDQQALIAGQDDLVHLETEDAACVDSILLQKPTGETVKADWKSTGTNQVAVTLPLKKMKPGELKLLVKQYGSKEPDTVLLRAFAQAGHLDSFTLHAGDLSGVLRGSHLDEVKELTLNGVHFTPGSLASTDAEGELPLATTDVKAAELLKEGDDATAKVALSDGRVLNLDTTVSSPRPRVALIGKSIQLAASSAGSNLQLAGEDDLPQNAQLTFSIHAQVPATFSGDEKVEVSTLRGAFLTTLTLASGLILEDSEVALATLDTGKAFASSASGPLRFRVIEKGIAGDWQPLAVLVRLPVFANLKCPDSLDQPCTLTGSKLFLVDQVSNNQQFDHATQVPEGFPGYALTVPHPTGGQLYVKLHDDPSVVNSIIFPVATAPSPTSDVAAKPAALNPTAAGAPSTSLPAAGPSPTSTKQDAVAPQDSASPTTNNKQPAPASNSPAEPSAGTATPPTAGSPQSKVSTTVPAVQKTAPPPQDSGNAPTTNAPSAITTK